MKNIIKNTREELFKIDRYNFDDVYYTYYVCANCNESSMLAILLPIIDKEEYENNSIFQAPEKIKLSHFLNFLFASLTNGTFGFALLTSLLFVKPKEPFFSQSTLMIDNKLYLH